MQLPACSGSSNVSSQPSTQQSTNQTRNYSLASGKHAEERPSYPHRFIPRIPIKEYVSQEANLTNPMNIHSVSRISGGQIFIHLSTKEIVENLIREKKNIKVGEQTLQIRPLFNRLKRFILSTISNSLIGKSLENLGVQMQTNITTIIAEIPGTGFAHTDSFR